MKTRIALSLACMAVIAAVGCGKEGYSEGDRFGVVNKFSHKGMICKSWEGELLLGGMKTATDANGNSSLTSNVWEFSVKPQDENKIVPLLQQAASSGKRVRLHYSQAYLEPACATSTDYFVKEVEFLP